MLGGVVVNDCLLSSPPFISTHIINLNPNHEINQTQTDIQTQHGPHNAKTPKHIEQLRELVIDLPDQPQPSVSPL